MQSKQYFTKIKNYPHEKSTEPKNLLNPFRIAPSFQTEPPPRALFKLSPYYNKKEEILIELPLLSGWQMGLEPTTFRTTI